MEKLEMLAYTTEAGIFHIQNKQRLQEWAKMNPGKQLMIRIDKRGSRRSNPQLRYYWGVVVETVRHGLINLGHELNKDEVHFFLKERFNSVPVENKKGEIIDIPGSTTQMTKTEFGEYIEKIARFSAEFLGEVIPQPNENLEMKFE
jgi:hypothetical protein